MKNKIDLLKKEFKKFDIDGYVIPKNDEFFSSFDKNYRLQNITKFSGSAGIAIVTKTKNYLFVDGRYTLQAKLQSGKTFKIVDITRSLPKNILKKIRLGIDPKLFTNKNLDLLFGNKIEMISIKENLIDKIFRKKTFRLNPFYSLDQKFTGESTTSKINKIVQFLNKKKLDYILITAPENVAWILNIRGHDHPNSPLPNSYLLIDRKKNKFLISEKSKIKNLINDKTIKKSEFFELKHFETLIKNLKKGKINIDQKTCSLMIEKIISNNHQIKKLEDPIYFLKSIKNKIEIDLMKKAHIEDGLALTRFIYWIKNASKKLDEVDAANILEKFRKKSKNYLYPSFDTIAGAGSNGAIIHYRAEKKNCKKINKNDIFLFDSGGQYKYGTTDVTRTICFNKPSKKIKDIFTRVLKGHIAVYLSNLKKENTGQQIDKRARKYLKDINLDYAHGTGHGVGFFLNVHEGPQSISKYNKIKLIEGMILSNEPGYYKENSFGIRIENLVHITNENKKLIFKNLTFAPIDTDLINFDLLNKEEKNYLFKYHLEIYALYSKFLKPKERKWLAGLI